MNWFDNSVNKQATVKTGTRLIHSGDQPSLTGEVMPSICVSTTFRQSTPGVPIGVPPTS